MKELISELVQNAITQLSNAQTIPSELTYSINIDASKDKTHGDFASNIALILSKQAGMPPRKLAELIIEKLVQNNNKSIEKIEMAGPGFINFFISSSSNFTIIKTIFEQKNNSFRQ